MAINIKVNDFYLSSMLKEIVTVPIVTALAWIGRIVRLVGDVIQFDRAYRFLFDRVVGIRAARDWRDEHVEQVAERVEDSDVEIPESNEELAEQVEATWRRTQAHIVRGETILALAVAVAAFLAPLWVVAVFVGLLLVSVSVRLTAVEPLAYTDPGTEEPAERLVAKRAWNEGVLAGPRATTNVVGLRLMREVDPRLYNHYLDEVLVPKAAGTDVSSVEAWKRMNPEATTIVREAVPAVDAVQEKVPDPDEVKGVIESARDGAVSKGLELQESVLELQDSNRGTENGAGKGDAGMADGLPGSRDELDDMSYRELQSVAKEVDVQANLSREEMTEELVKTLGIEEKKASGEAT